MSDIPQMVMEMWLAAHADDDESKKIDNLGDDETTVTAKDRRRTETKLPSSERDSQGRD